ncbi:hypothetical protein C2U63_30605 [Burkholderia pseudomallei]|uniref:Uncharacterized protein n=1 Tax=Burkholderia pseudomallei TaxID=28450 RepID=A0AAX0U957_BURPE|nr:hypothetical protein BHT10_33570 [Burkholderia pseudomallei]PNW93251.1 hypothetical protein CF649_35220 [Burkholderia sp. 136(2017)]PNX12694.1 hypothetical protein CF650_24150 [Burkholderia sp. 129]PNX24913.1 hypothetical protein CF647_33365 [Burkholderia sp. 117]PNX30039.1 hypothetical protein CF648_35105 [Burkholderia sp. 137]
MALGVRRPARSRRNRRAAGRETPAGAACGAVPGPLAPRARALTTLGKLDFAQRMAEPVPHNEQTVVRLIR